jgi:Ca2+-binding EF-hand superfamily protein
MLIANAMLLFLAQAAATPTQPARPAAPQAPQAQTRASVEAEIRAHFQQIDSNKDGRVDRAEANAFHAAQRAALIAQRRQLGTATFSRADTNKDGNLNLEEFLAAAAPIPEQREVWFDANDTDRNGRVEIAEAITRANRSFDEIDANKDGKVTSQEMAAAIRKQQAAAAAAAANQTPRPATGR